MSLLPSSRNEEIDSLRRMAGQSPVSLTIKIEAHDSRTKPRRYYKSDEEFAEHQREVKIYRSAECTYEWEYPSSPSLWSAADVDNVIRHVIDTLAQLPLVTKHDRSWYARHGHRSKCACAVGFDFETRRRMPHLKMWVTSGVAPYWAEVLLPELPALSAIIRLIEIHGSADVHIGLRGAGGYSPTLAYGRAR